MKTKKLLLVKNGVATSDMKEPSASENEKDKFEQKLCFWRLKKNAKEEKKVFLCLKCDFVTASIIQEEEKS